VAEPAGGQVPDRFGRVPYDPFAPAAEVVEGDEGNGRGHGPNCPTRPCPTGRQEKGAGSAARQLNEQSISNVLAKQRHAFFGRPAS